MAGFTSAVHTGRFLRVINVTGVPRTGAGPTQEQLRNDGTNADNVLTFGMGYGIPMYSPLRQIDKSNVKRLVPVWSTNLMSEQGELAHPAIYEGVMYIVNGNWTFALDVANGRQIWRTPVEYDRAVLRISNAGAIMRGIPVLYNGKLYRTTLDAHVVGVHPHRAIRANRNVAQQHVYPAPDLRAKSAVSNSCSHHVVHVGESPRYLFKNSISYENRPAYTANPRRPVAFDSRTAAATAATQSGNTAVNLISINCCGKASRAT